MENIKLFDRALFESAPDHVVEKLLRRCLSKGIVRFSFTKKDGTERVANGTTNKDFIAQAKGSAQTFSASSAKMGPYVNFFDLDAKGWRSCLPGQITDILDEDPAYAAQFNAPAVQADGTIEPVGTVAAAHQAANSANSNNSSTAGGSNTSSESAPASLSAIGTKAKVFVDSDQSYHDGDTDAKFDQAIGTSKSEGSVVITGCDDNILYQTLMYFRFRLYTTYDPEDGFWAWTTAYSAAEAADQILSEYWGVVEADLFEVKPYEEAKEEGQAKATDKSLQTYVGADNSQTDKAFLAHDSNTIEAAENAGMDVDGEYPLYDLNITSVPDEMKKPETLKRLLNTGAVKFTFQKKDGTMRNAIGTTNMNLIEDEFKPKSYNSASANTQARNKNKTTISFFDIEAKGWRSCRNESISWI